MAFFKYFTQRWHELPTGEKILLCNITRRVAITQAAKEQRTILLDYEIKGNERPEVLSYRLYGTTDYWWVVLMVNNILDVDAQWPLNHEELENLIERKYGDARGDTHHWTDVDGNITDPRAVMLTGGFPSLRDAAEAMSLIPYDNEEYETMVNDAKRQIKLIDPTYIDTFGTQLEKVMNDG